MKYCAKFYELAQPLRDIMEEDGVTFTLAGEVTTPYGTVPEYICYSGSFNQSYAQIVMRMNQILYGTWSPADGEGCNIMTKEECDMGGIEWDRE